MGEEGLGEGSQQQQGCGVEEIGLRREAGWSLCWGSWS